MLPLLYLNDLVTPLTKINHVLAINHHRIWKFRKKNVQDIVSCAKNACKDYTFFTHHVHLKQIRHSQIPGFANTVSSS